MKNKVVLIILDGWGIGDGSHSDAIANAHTPFIDGLYSRYPHSRLLTDGENVGLPDGQMGNSEVGHLNIGAGRVVYQDLVKINKAIADHSIEGNKTLINGFKYAKDQGKKVHLMGLVSDGGVHSSQNHLHKLCDMAEAHGLKDVFIHAFTDGRDTDPKSGIGFLGKLQQHLSGSSGKIASVIGRYYAMDRDKRWERINLAYEMLVLRQGKRSADVIEAVRESYNEGITDEFIKPVVMEEDDKIIPGIGEGDLVICFNFRTDRCREITMALTQRDFPDYNMRKMTLHYITMTHYDAKFVNVNPVFVKQDLTSTLGEIISKAGKSQIRIAETEKYPHVTYFFSGGREQEFPGEKRIMIPSPKVATYDLKPQMSAPEVKDAIVGELKKGQTDFVCLNFANPDMVGHTGVYQAVIKALETIDRCTKEVVETGMQHGYSFVIIADHGNADYMVNKDGTPNTAHSLNPVPCIVITPGNHNIKLNDGILADIAPTILSLMGMDIPLEMTGKTLLEFDNTP